MRYLLLHSHNLPFVLLYRLTALFTLRHSAFVVFDLHGGGKTRNHPPTSHTSLLYHHEPLHPQVSSVYLPPTMKYANSNVRSLMLTWYVNNLMCSNAPCEWCFLKVIFQIHTYRFVISDFDFTLSHSFLLVKWKTPKQQRVGQQTF